MKWFKETVSPMLSEYDIVYHLPEKGDFGDLERVELEGNEKGVTIDFWSSGWLNLHAVDYKTEDELLNVLLEPEQHLEKELFFNKLLQLLKG